jgi:hypothetical protein
MPEHRIFSTRFASVYPLYVQKAERQGRTKEEAAYECREVMDTLEPHAPADGTPVGCPGPRCTLWESDRGAVL